MSDREKKAARKVMEAAGEIPKEAEDLAEMLVAGFIKGYKFGLKEKDDEKTSPHERAQGHGMVTIC